MKMIDETKLPQFDCYQTGFKEDVLNMLDGIGIEQFRGAHPEYPNTKRNNDLLQSFLQDRPEPLPLSLRNLEIAYYALGDDGQLEPAIPQVTYTEVPRDKRHGITRADQTVRLRFDTGNMAQSQLTRELPERREELLGDVIARRQFQDGINRAKAGEIGKPINAEFKEQYRRSLREHRKTAEGAATMGYAPRDYYVACEAVLKEHPEMNQNSITFSNLVRSKLEAN
jgi:hypothetical protein